ncbi:MAG: molybdenum cofactor guanylyltransferase, partial [Phycisphaerae bacterium]
LSADGFDAALITACDHPLVPHAVFQYLYDQAEVLATENARAMALQYGGRTYPMPGLYRVDGLDTLEERIRSGALRLLEWVEGCQPSYLPLDVLMELDPDLRSLINMNSPAEVAAIQCLLRENG